MRVSGDGAPDVQFAERAVTSMYILTASSAKTKLLGRLFDSPVGERNLTVLRATGSYRPNGKRKDLQRAPREGESTVDTRTLGPQRGPDARWVGVGHVGTPRFADRGPRQGVSRAVFKFSVRSPRTPRGLIINLARATVRLILALTASHEES